ncbi:drug resistance transporter, EmrB/QacA subfamily [Nocardioides terrae]|uniref:Drug resistance transporter, EmrB/QacA subfamily n=1 Tax=Nocardioides terrae TaxID=574651 RepID=A0A1I1NJ34_9ACTN|nr:MFS transporter [Nocardioides terrae]SFC93750.1 drug resistance transporter, EmrB/QacA subfamily [Nocardioides terrae]
MSTKSTEATGPTELHPPAAHGHSHGDSHGHSHGHSAAAQEGDGPRKPWAVLALMLAAQVMVVLDVSVVNVALPSIATDLHLTSTDYQWAVSAYVLLSGGFLLLGGRMADLFDRRRMFLTGLAVFTAGSLASGLAAAPLALILSRGAQGAGAAMLTPAAMSIVMTTYAGRQRATALGLWGTVASMGIAAGVLFGGILTTVFDWRAVFFINVPVGAAVLAGVLRKVPAMPGTGGRRLDISGALTLVAGLVAFVYAVESITSHGWTAPQTLVAATAAAVLLAAFTVNERKVADPIVPPATWRIRSLISASVVMAGVTGAVVGVIFLSSLYLQQVLGASPLVAGLEFLPLAAFITLSAAVASKVLPHAGAKKLITAGLVMSAAGALVLASIDTDPSYLTDVLPGFALLGLGVGPMFVAISVAAMSDVPQKQSGVASGLMMTGHEIGAALGVAALTAVAGDLTTRAGIITGTHDAYLAVAIGLVALLAPTALLPAHDRAAAAAAGYGHGHGHGH